MKIYADNSTEPQKNTTSLSKRKLRVIPNGLPLGLESKSKKRHLYESLCDIWENKREFYKAMVWCQRKADVAHDRWSQLILARVQNKAGYTDLAEGNLRWAAEEGAPSLRGWASQYLAGHHLNLGSMPEACLHFARAQKLNFPISEKERQRYANCE